MPTAVLLKFFIAQPATACGRRTQEHPEKSETVGCQNATTKIDAGTFVADAVVLREHRSCGGCLVSPR